MGTSYKQLSFEERVTIGLLLGADLSLREIAEEIGRSPSTVSREIQRNSRWLRSRGYQSAVAQQAALLRRKLSRKFPRLKNEHIRRYVAEKIRLGWSPELISGRIKRELPDVSISHEAIYQFIYAEQPELIQFLPQARKKRQRRRHSKNLGGSRIPQRISISERPQQVALRKELGHWEVDTALSDKNGKAALLVAIERKSRYTKIAKLRQKCASEVEHALLNFLLPLPPALRKTLTYDNGGENSRHYLVNNVLGTKSYFCNPYHSWEKGSVENSISLIRRRLQKTRNLDILSLSQIKQIEAWMNNRPRKCLQFQTPYEMLHHHLRVALTP